jgi:hypothetical protein
MSTWNHAHPRGHCHQWRVGLTAWMVYRERTRANIDRSYREPSSDINEALWVVWSIVSTRAPVSRAGLRHQREAQGLGLLASVLHLTLLIFVEILCGAPFPIGCFLFEHVGDNVASLWAVAVVALAGPSVRRMRRKNAPRYLGLVRRLCAAMRKARLARFWTRRRPVARTLPPLI